MPRIRFDQDVHVRDGDGVVVRSFRAGEVRELSAASCRHHVTRRRARFVDAAEEAAAEVELKATRAVEGTPDATASPAARELAAANGIDLTALDGSGRNGLVTKGDVEAHLKAHVGEGATTPPAKADPPATEPPAAPQGPDDANGPGLPGV